jgi:hypothetical protein
MGLHPVLGRLIDRQSVKSFSAFGDFSTVGFTVFAAIYRGPWQNPADQRKDGRIGPGSERRVSTTVMVRPLAPVGNRTAYLKSNAKIPAALPRPVD